MPSSQPSSDSNGGIPPELANLSFEDALERIESIVENLENGDVPLADLLVSYEEASSLLKHCQQALDQAQLRIEKLNGKPGDADFEAFNSDADAGSDGQNDSQDGD